MTEDPFLPPLGDIKPRAFSSGDDAMSKINRIAALIFAYILFILYPAYGFLRWLWSDDLSPFDLKGIVTAILTAAFLAWFSRRALVNRVINSVK